MSFPSNNLLIDILYFPAWWYSQGLRNFIQWLGKQIKSVNYILGFKILLFNLFKPFFGDYTLSGRLMSFPLRVIWFIVVLALTVIFVSFFILLFFVWLLWLPFLVGGVIGLF